MIPSDQYTPEPLNVKIRLEWYQKPAAQALTAAVTQQVLLDIHGQPA